MDLNHPTSPESLSRNRTWFQGTVATPYPSVAIDWPHHITDFFTDGAHRWEVFCVTGIDNEGISQPGPCTSGILATLSGIEPEFSERQSDAINHYTIEPNWLSIFPSITGARSLDARTLIGDLNLFYRTLMSQRCSPCARSIFILPTSQNRHSSNTMSVYKLAVHPTPFTTAPLTSLHILSEERGLTPS